MKEKVLVLMGGTSQEREVSLRSGAAVLAALKNNDYQVEGLDLQSDSIQKIIAFQPDVVFLALHGKNGEDGTVQGMLEIMNIPYTGSGVAASAICMNKILTKKLLALEGFPTADFRILKYKQSMNYPQMALELMDGIGLPMVLKAATQGSSIGTYIVKEQAALVTALGEVFQYDDEVLVEKFVDGVELTVPVIGNEEALALPVIEITSSNEFYDYESKYTPGMCQHIIPARIDDKTRDMVMSMSEKVYESLNCRGFARVDFMVDRSGNPYVLEINTIPGMTEMSLVPDSARAYGMSFEVLIKKIVRFALENDSIKKDI
ncbi:MAG: D-alanine--D-alanine ligase [Bacillota bacterium]|nr:D-alanine--D-alanine ligase [Bacillota bacterium]